MPSLQLYVKTVAGKEISVEVKGGDSVESLKVKILEKEGVPFEQQRLMYDGKPLDDGT